MKIDIQDQRLHEFGLGIAIVCLIGLPILFESGCQLIKDVIPMIPTIVPSTQTPMPTIAPTVEPTLVVTPEATSTPVTPPTATPTQEPASGCGNVPDIPCKLSEIDESGWSKESKRNYSAPRSKVGEFHGEVFCGNHEASTNFRYRFRSHIEWDINRFCGFKAGEINIYFTGQNDEMVRWQVTP